MLQHLKNCIVVDVELADYLLNQYRDDLYWLSHVDFFNKYGHDIHNSRNTYDYIVTKDRVEKVKEQIEEDIYNLFIYKDLTQGKDNYYIDYFCETKDIKIGWIKKSDMLILEFNKNSSIAFLEMKTILKYLSKKFKGSKLTTINFKDYSLTKLTIEEVLNEKEN